MKKEVQISGRERLLNLEDMTKAQFKHLNAVLRYLECGKPSKQATGVRIVGYKPTFGHITRAGVKSISESLDTVGGFGRTVEDIALLAAALTGDRRLLSLDTSQTPRIGVYRSPQ